MSDRRHVNHISQVLIHHTLRLSLLCGVLALLPCAIAQAAMTIDAEVAYTTDNNVTRAEFESDILHDQFFTVAAGLNYLQWLNSNNRLVYRGFVRGESYRKYDGLSNVTAGGSVTYQYRESGAFLAPTYGAFFKAAIAEYQSDIRDSNLYSLGISWRKPFTDRIGLTTILAGNLRDSDSTVFDTKEISLLLNLDYEITSRMTMYATYNYLNGDIVSTSVYVTSPRLKFVNNADAINADDAFASGAVAYRLKATTHVVTLGTNFKLADQHSLDFSGRYVDSQATAGITYKKMQFSLAYLARF